RQDTAAEPCLIIRDGQIVSAESSAVFDGTSSRTPIPGYRRVRRNGGPEVIHATLRTRGWGSTIVKDGASRNVDRAGVYYAVASIGRDDALDELRNAISIDAFIAVAADAASLDGKVAVVPYP